MTRLHDVPGGDAQLTCREVVEIITDYLENALDPDQRWVVEAHLATCPGCQVYLDQMRTTIRVLGRVPLDTLSARAQADLTRAFRQVHPAPGTGL
jgi:anti-sigma factor RsiW